MSKILSCGDLVPGCKVVFRGETEDDVLRQAEDHSKAIHHIAEVPKGLRKKMHRLIRDEKPVKAA